MRKRILIICLLLSVACTFNACSRNSKEDDGIVKEVVEKEALEKVPSETEVEETEVEETEVIKTEGSSINQVTEDMSKNTDVIPNLTEENTQNTEDISADTGVSPDEQIFEEQSEDGSILISVTTYEDGNENRIKDITILVNGIKLITIDNIVGYYNSVSIDIQNSLAIINYYGRKWSNFALLDLTNGQILYYEPFSFSDIESIYRDNNKMDYDINENSVITLSCDQIMDNDTVIISYEVYDRKDNMQSGNFKYIISRNAFEDLHENEATPVG